jgi:hypothetical protein
VIDLAVVEFVDLRIWFMAWVLHVGHDGLAMIVSFIRVWLGQGWWYGHG